MYLFVGIAIPSKSDPVEVLELVKDPIKSSQCRYLGVAADLPAI